MGRNVHVEQVDEGTGHRWAAEALLQYLKQKQHICDSTP